MKQKKPKHCKGCLHYHRAAHKQGSQYYDSKYTHWCCKFGISAKRAVSLCLHQDGKTIKC